MPHELLLDSGGSIAEITITAPGRNALDRSRIEELHDLLRGLASREDIRAVILSGAGGNFCAGRIRNMELRTKDEIATDLAPILALNKLLEEYPVPVIGAIEGVALGFGFGLATLCDVTVAAEDAVFALTELAHGIPPLIVLSYFFRFVPYKVGFDLALTGREVDAASAVRLGLATTMCPSGHALEIARGVAAHVAGLDPEAVRLLRRFARDRAAILDTATASHGADEIASLLAKENR